MQLMQVYKQIKELRDFDKKNIWNSNKKKKP